AVDDDVGVNLLRQGLGFDGAIFGGRAGEQTQIDVFDSAAQGVLPDFDAAGVFADQFGVAFLIFLVELVKDTFTEGRAERRFTDMPRLVDLAKVGDGNV